MPGALDRPSSGTVDLAGKMISTLGGRGPGRPPGPRDRLRFCSTTTSFRPSARRRTWKWVWRR
ncbi:hypothetical protein OIU93_07535 [Paeniglutamicibacter sp. ZC-3]|nr:hypothetical protein [Paeniglutamicibacter sp. ZC-3]MCV9994149.1 hypothetical protein [Paeniglutamicibacter sp. ZC-3]